MVRSGLGWSTRVVRKAVWGTLRWTSPGQEACHWPFWVSDSLPPHTSASPPAVVEAGSGRRCGCKGSTQTGLLEAQEEEPPGLRDPGTPSATLGPRQPWAPDPPLQLAPSLSPRATRGRGLGATWPTSLLSTQLPTSPPPHFMLFSACVSRTFWLHWLFLVSLPTPASTLGDQDSMFWSWSPHTRHTPGSGRLFNK